MKSKLIAGAILASCVGFTSVALAEVIEKKVTETTTYTGTVTELAPSNSTIIVKGASSAPRIYTYDTKTVFLDDLGNVVSYEQVRRRPVKIYVDDDDNKVVSKVIVTREIDRPATVERRETVTERRTEIK